MKLSVNLNKIALLRNSRAGRYPSLLAAAQTCIDAGAHGLTLHWREDNRHAQANDVRELNALCKAHGVEFNLEGDIRSELIDLMLEVRPTQYTLVPVTPGEVTSDHGWHLPQETALIEPVIKQAKAAGVRTSIFVDANVDMIKHVASSGADRIEIYTEPYARTYGGVHQPYEYARLQATAKEATHLGLGVNAGHDLNLMNLPLLARKVPEILEVSIGHAIINDALYLGLRATVDAYVQATRGQAFNLSQWPEGCLSTRLDD